MSVHPTPRRNDLLHVNAPASVHVDRLPPSRVKERHRFFTSSDQAHGRTDTPPGTFGSNDVRRAARDTAHRYEIEESA